MLARDAAVMALLYGSGLRISEALGLKVKDIPAPGQGDTIMVTGKGNKTRMVPVLPPVLRLIADYMALCPYALAPDGPAFVGAKGGPLSPRIIQLTMERLRGALDLAGDRHAACAAAFVRDPPARPRRRPAGDPGTARPRFAFDHADLYRGRHRSADGGLPQHPSAWLVAITAKGPRRAVSGPSFLMPSREGRLECVPGFLIDNAAEASPLQLGDPL